MDPGLETFHNLLRPIGTNTALEGSFGERGRDILVVDRPWRGLNGAGESVRAVRVVEWQWLRARDCASW